MVIIRLFELNEDQAVYEYFPEGRDTGGKVAFDRKNKKRSILQKSEGDSNTYAFHALRRIEEYDALGNFPKEDTAVWY